MSTTGPDKPAPLKLTSSYEYKALTSVRAFFIAQSLDWVEGLKFGEDQMEHTVILYNNLSKIRMTVETDIEAKDRQEALEKAAEIVKTLIPKGWTIHLPN